MELRCYWLCLKAFLANLLKWSGIWYDLCKTQILTRYLFSALKNFLLNRSGITEGPIPVFKSIWGERKYR